MSGEYLEGRIVCVECGEWFDTIEGNSSGFCSADCDDANAEREDLTTAYWNERVQGAHVFPS